MILLVHRWPARWLAREHEAPGRKLVAESHASAISHLNTQKEHILVFRTGSTRHTTSGTFQHTRCKSWPHREAGGGDWSSNELSILNHKLERWGVLSVCAFCILFALCRHQMKSETWSIMSTKWMLCIWTCRRWPVIELNSDFDFWAGFLGFLGFSWQVVADLNMRLQAVFSLDEVVTGRFASGILQWTHSASLWRPECCCSGKCSAVSQKQLGGKGLKREGGKLQSFS